MAMRNPQPPRTIEKMTDVIRWPGQAWREIERLRAELRRLSSLIDGNGQKSEAMKDILVDDGELEPLLPLE